MSERPHIEHWFSAEDEACLTHEQMLGYAQGKLEATAKNAVERHLLNCELCAMASEGLTEMEEAEVAAAVGSITDQAWSRVEELSKPSKRSAYFWMSSAAAILLLIVVGFFVVDRQNKQQLKELADGMFELPQVEQAETPAEEKEPVFAERNQENKPVATEPPPPKAILPPPPMRMAPTEEEVEEVETTVDDAEEFNGFADDAIDEDLDFLVVDGVDSEDSWGDAPVETVASADVEVAEEEEVDFKAEKPARDQRYNAQEEGLESDFASSEVQMDSVGLAFDELGNLSTGSQQLSEVVVTAVPRVEPAKGKVSVNSKDLVVTNEIEKTMQNAPIAANRASDSKKEFKRARNKSKPGKADKKRAEETTQDRDRLGGLADQQAPSLFDRGMAAYERSDFKQGAALLRQAATETPSNLYAHFYAGICYLQLEQSSAAIFHLDRVLAQPNNSLEEDAEWYKSIALLQQGEKRKAKTILEGIEQEGRSRARDARKALEKLDQP